MSAAATAAGYLYASGRLRNRATRGEEGAPREDSAHRPQNERPRRADASPRRAEASVRRKEPLVGRIPAEPHAEPRAREPASREPEKARPAPRVEYRTRRWRPEF